jgi:Flp pilus assembly protein TadG
MVEFSLALPLLVMMIMGFITIGELYIRQQILVDTAGYIARRASLLSGADSTRPAWPDYRSDAREILKEGFDPDSVTVNITPSGIPDPCYPHRITVTVRAGWYRDVPFYGRLGAELAGTSHAMCEKE